VSIEVRFGAQLWNQASDWAHFRDAAIAAEAAGWDGVWTWDHLLAIQGPWQQPILEGWLALTGVAALTSRVTVGLMVGANTFRQPGLTAKLVTTLDAISGGRSILGIGGAWFEREHDAFGLPFGASVGERLDRLDESVGIIRRLLDGERVTHTGRFYALHDAICEPRPVQPHLPILIGGSGRTKTLRTVAMRADAWNTSGTVDAVRDNDAVLREHCAAVGRDQGAIERTVSFPIVIRATREAAAERLAELRHHNGMEQDFDTPPLVGPPDEIAAVLRPYLELGFRHVIARLPAPYDLETIDRIGEVRAAVEALPLVGVGA
jgi:F420-dependent oxidoreductase-like protein